MAENVFDLKDSLYNILMNSKVNCGCGCAVSGGYHKRHLKTKKHTKLALQVARRVLPQVAVRILTSFAMRCSKV